MVREGLDLAILRSRPGMLADGDRLLFSETVFPGVQSIAVAGGGPGPVAPQAAAGGSRGSREIAWSTWLDLLGMPAKARPTIVRFDTFSAAIGAAVAGAGIALGRRPLIDLELDSGRLTRLFANRSLPGSWDFVIRGRPDAARDVHVDHLANPSASAVAACRAPRLTGSPMLDLFGVGNR